MRKPRFTGGCVLSRGLGEVGNFCGVFREARRFRFSPRPRFFYAGCLCGISALPSGNGARRPAGRGEIFARQVAFPKARRARCKNARKKNCGNACEKRLRNLPARANANVNAVAHFCSRIRARSECLRGSLLSYVGEYELLRESGV